MPQYRSKITSTGCLIIALVGCHHRESDHLERPSHVVSTHWPESVEDARAKLQERLGILQSNPADHSARRELEEIISWLPEVAADTDLSELQWQPIYDQSELLRKRLTSGSSLNSVRGEIDQLLELINVPEDNLGQQPEG